MIREPRWSVHTAARRRGGATNDPEARRCALAMAALLVVLGSGPASAARWQIQPTANLGANYDDNVRLTTTDPESALSANLNAAIRATRSTEVSDVGFALGVQGSRYVGVSDLDNDSAYASLDLGYRLERNVFRLGAQFLTQSTLSSEQATTGLVQENVQQNQWSINGGWIYLLSERITLDVAASFQDVSYEDSQGGESVQVFEDIQTIEVAQVLDGEQSFPLADYRDSSVELGGRYLWTERLALTGRVSYGRYETQVFTNEYNNISVLAGAEYQFSETSSLSALAGVRHTEQTVGRLDGSTLTRDTSGPTYTLRFFKQFERGGGLDLVALRELAPSGSAQVLDTTELSANVSFPLRPRWIFALNAIAYRNRNLEGGTGLSDRTYASVAPSIAYEIDQSMLLSFGYQLRWQQRDEIDSDAVSNSVFLNFSWTRPWDL